MENSSLPVAVRVLKCPCDKKNHFLLFFRFLKCVCLTLTYKILSFDFYLKAVYFECFGFHGTPLLTFKTDRLDLRGLDPGKSDVKGSLA